MNSTQTLKGFQALGVAAHQCATLEKYSIVEPTPIQAAAIPVASNGADLIGIAQTGTGKTLAFGLPIVKRLAAGQNALVLVPTRELAQQVAETLHKLDLRSVIVVGGASMHLQTKQLRSNPQVIVATPGRLIDHLERGSVRLGRTTVVVLDEADRMLDMGFAPAIKRILDRVPTERQTMLFSATMPKEIEELANSYLESPERIEVSPAGSTPDLVDQEVVYTEFETKHDVVEDLLLDFTESVLVFTRTRHGARKLAKVVRDMGHTAAEIHSDRTLSQRMEAMNGFKVGKYRVLVATDIAARGIDVKGISLVLNYDVPEHADDYVHRIGRTGRAGKTGHAITIALRQQVREVRDIEKLMGVELRVSDRSTIDAPMLHRPRHNSRKEREAINGKASVDNRRSLREDRVEFRSRKEDAAPRADTQSTPPRMERPASGPRSEKRNRFEKPIRPGKPAFNARRSDGQKPSWSDRRQSEGFDKPKGKKSFTDRVSDMARPAEQRDFKNPKTGYKAAKPGKKSYGPHAGRGAQKKSNETSIGSIQPAPTGRTGHRGWSGRPKARRFK